MSDQSNNDLDNPGRVGPDQPDGRGKRDYDYKVDYGKPPEATQFKKGQSGNPKGRKKKEEIDDVRNVVDDVLAEPVKVRMGGQVRTVSKLEAMFEAQRMKALQGDQKAARALFRLAQKTSMFSKVKPKGGIVIDPPGTAQERMILRHSMPRRRNASVDQAADPRIVRGDESCLRSIVEALTPRPESSLAGRTTALAISVRRPIPGSSQGNPAIPRAAQRATQCRQPAQGDHE